LAKSEKENVKFQEKEKFLTQKQKKLQKAIQTVCVPVYPGRRFYCTHWLFRDRTSFQHQRRLPRSRNTSRILTDIANKSLPLRGTWDVRRKN
jgi:hypothetical protein